jgi:hypothetical protein
MSRIWFLIHDVMRRRQEETIEEAVPYQELSKEERAVVEPYREYVAQAGPPWPVLSMASGVVLGGFGAFTCVAIIVTRGWLFRFLSLPALTASLALVWASKTHLYERKKKQKELYDTLRENPRRLLDSEYRARFDEYVDPPVRESPADADGPGEPP